VDKASVVTDRCDLQINKPFTAHARRSNGDGVFIDNSAKLSDMADRMKSRASKGHEVCELRSRKKPAARLKEVFGRAVDQNHSVFRIKNNMRIWKAFEQYPKVWGWFRLLPCFNHQAAALSSSKRL
jgi:hypothetical protein